MFFLKKVLILLSLSLVLLLSSGVWAKSSLASIRQQEEAPGQILYQSRQSIQDNTGQTWQVVLFKRVKDGHVAYALWPTLVRRLLFIRVL